MEDRKTFAENENGQWVTENGEWVKMNFSTDRFTPEKVDLGFSSYPITMEVDYRLLTIDGKAQYSSSRANVDIDKAISAGIITMAEADSYAETMRKMVKWALEQDYYRESTTEV